MATLEDRFWYGMDRNKPAAITVDSGLTDGESFRFRLNKVTRGRGSHVRDLEHMLGEPYHMEKSSH